MDKLLSAKELAFYLDRSPRYVGDMKRAGFPMPGGRASLNQAIDWLGKNPDFSTTKARQMPGKK